MFERKKKIAQHVSSLTIPVLIRGLFREDLSTQGLSNRVSVAPPAAAEVHQTSRDHNPAPLEDIALIQDSSVRLHPSSLSSDSLSLLHVIHFAGGSVPECFFQSASTWTEAGETEQVDVPLPEVLLSPVQKRDVRVQLLDSGCLIESYEDDRPSTLMVHPELSRLFRLYSNEAAAPWKELALAATCRAFPRWPHIAAM